MSYSYDCEYGDHPASFSIEEAISIAHSARDGFLVFDMGHRLQEDVETREYDYSGNNYAAELPPTIPSPDGMSKAKRARLKREQEEIKTYSRVEVRYNLQLLDTTIGRAQAENNKALESSDFIETIAALESKSLEFKEQQTMASLKASVSLMRKAISILYPKFEP